MEEVLEHGKLQSEWCVKNNLKQDGNMFVISEIEVKKWTTTFLRWAIGVRGWVGSTQESGRKPQEESHNPKQPCICHSDAQCLLCHLLSCWKWWIWIFGNHSFVLWNERCCGLAIISLSAHWLIMCIFDFGFCTMVFNIWELWSMKIFGLRKASGIKYLVVSFLYVVFHNCLAQNRYTASNCWVNEWIWWEKQLSELSRWKSKEPRWIYFGITLANYKGQHTCLYFYYILWV